MMQFCDPGILDKIVSCYGSEKYEAQQQVIRLQIKMKHCECGKCNHSQSHMDTAVKVKIKNVPCPVHQATVPHYIIPGKVNIPQTKYRIIYYYNPYFRSTQRNYILMNTNAFALRHIGPRESDLQEMLETIGVESLDQLIYETIPDDSRLKKDLDLPPA